MAYSRDCLEVIFSSDDNYARHMGAAAYSLLDRNRDFGHINVYMIDNKISPENRARLEKTVSAFPNASLIFIDFAAWLDKLKLDLAWPISLSSYARLFVRGMLPDTVGRVLYMDCDMIVCDSLRALWETDLGGCVLGAVQDFVNDATKAAVGLAPEEPYFNAGMLLIDMDEWRRQGVEDDCLAFIEAHQGNVTHHDQGVLNGVLHGKRMILPARYNLMTIHYVFNRRKLIRYFGDHAAFYTEQEIGEAKDTPAVLHYTPSFTSRPWVKSCRHPKRQLYWDALAATPWQGHATDADTSRWYVRLINWRYRCLPY